ncbi:MAG TPA: alpha/beta hydrolase [Clostridiales bacterium]|jgi:acetyl esterase/lipase|nr:alpha/beta hydrolase [Clostridiales bacterium]
MDRKYDVKLADYIRENSYTEKFEDLDVEVKPLPDGIEGGMDTRVYKNFRMLALLKKLLPKSVFKVSFDEKGLKMIRGIFNKVDSHPMVLEKIYTDTEYVAVEGGEISLKVYRKDKTLKDLPILYYMHGGGFIAGRTEVVEEAMKLLAVKYNILIFSVNYRLAPEYPFPTGHEDCYRAFEWILENASKYGGDASKVFVAGDSAGGNLAQFITNRSLDEKLDNVRGQILLYPVLNLSDERDEFYNINFDKLPVYEKHKSAIDLAMGMMGGSMGELTKLLKVDNPKDDRISPYLNIRENNPPTLISVGEFDPLRLESFAHARKLKSKGVQVNAVYFRGMTHAYLDQVGNFPQSEICVEDMGEFIQKHS